MNNAYIRAQQCKVKEAKFPFVKIGSQYWTTKNLSLAVTPQGNTIPEVQANGNVEKITNAADREFSSDTGFWSKAGLSAIYSGLANIKSTDGTFSGISKVLLTIGQSYRIAYSVVSNRGGSLRIDGMSVGSTDIPSNVGSYIYYGIAIQSTIIIKRSAICDIDIDNVSIQEIGWSGSQELYDGIYAQTSGTEEQKTYAAVKAAAMWSNYNNDAPTGLIYGKLYNWFAVKLFQMDIDYYNAANPTKKWASGFRMPTQTEFQALSTYLGGDAVSGGHLKEAGLEHWNSPNTGADNSSGFSALGGGKRQETGVFADNLGYAMIWSITEDTTLANRMYWINTSISTVIDITPKARGLSIRLIKS